MIRPSSTTNIFLDLVVLLVVAILVTSAEKPLVFLVVVRRFFFCEALFEYQLSAHNNVSF